MPDAVKPNDADASIKFENPAVDKLIKKGNKSLRAAQMQAAASQKPQSGPSAGSVFREAQLKAPVRLTQPTIQALIEKGAQLMADHNTSTAAADYARSDKPNNGAGVLPESDINSAAAQVEDLSATLREKQRAHETSFSAIDQEKILELAKTLDAMMDKIREASGY